MQAGLILLCLAYVLSQFFRAFLAVLAGTLQADIGATPEDLADASGLWFLAFAAMQIPVGWALDKIGPRRTASLLLLLGGGGGAALFALATGPGSVSAAMLLIGIGCSPVLMASYYIFAIEHPPHRFAALAAIMLGVGSVGNLIASYPMALASEVMGWRAALWGLAALSAAVAIGIFATVRDPKAPQSEAKGSLLDLLKMPVMWAILPMMLVNYGPTGATRGLWIGPYLSDVFNLTTSQIGQATLLMGCAMIAGTFTYGPLDRIFKTRKWVVLVGNSFGALMLFGLAAFTGNSAILSVILMAALGFFAASFPVIMAHGRSFMPPHLVGRGVTLMNLFGIGGVGVIQFASGRLHSAISPDPVSAPYTALFLFFGCMVLIGITAYSFSRDSVE